MPHITAWNKTKINLMMDKKNIFYINILFSLRQSWNTEISAARVNGTHLEINPDWFLSLTEKERMGLAIHEVSHVAYDHITRLGNRDGKTFNQAADYKINNDLIKAGYTLPADALVDPKYDKNNTEQIYGILYEETEKQKAGIGTDGNENAADLSDDINYTEGLKEQQEMQQEIKNIVVMAAQMTKDIGNLPADIQIAITALVSPKLPWNIILQNYLQSFAKEDYSWQKINRRYLPDFYLPSLYNEALDHICVIVDASSSVTDEEFAVPISETIHIQQVMKPNKLTLVSFNTRICDVHEITPQTDILSEIKLTGRGGTDIHCVYEWLNKNEPKITLIFTDGEFYEPNLKLNNLDVIWLIHNNPDFTSEVGQIIHYEI